MSSEKFRKKLFPIGLIAMSLGLMCRAIFHVPNFFSGFLIGFGLPAMIRGFIIKFRKPTA